MEPNAALQEPPAELSMPTVLLSVWQSCGREMYNWEHSPYSQAPSLVWDVHTVHKIHRYAINRTKNPIFSSSPFSKIASLSCAISKSSLWYASVLKIHGEKQCFLLPAQKHVHVDTPTQIQGDYKALP